LKKKDYNYSITDSPPLSVIQQPLVSRRVHGSRIENLGDKASEDSMEQREILVKSQRPKKYGPLDPEEHVTEICVLRKKSTLDGNESGEVITPEG
jgi:hypothetical protein